MAKQSSTKKSPLRVAFIGAGGIAGTHMQCLKDMGDVQIVAAADLNKKGVEAKAQEFGFDGVYTDYKKMLKEVKPDAVSVCTPNGLHAQNTIDALNAKAHVIVEKPMAMNAKDAQKMVDVAKRNKRKLVIGFQYRYSPSTQVIRQAVDAGKFGKVLYGRVQALRRRGIPSWGVFGRKDLQGGGPMIDIGVHALEMTHYAMGSPKPVSAVGSIFTYLGNKKPVTHAPWGPWDYKTYTVEDLAVGQIRFDNGAVISIESSFAGHMKEDKMTFEIWGEKAGATFDPLSIQTDMDGQMVNIQPDRMPAESFQENFKLKMRSFVEHVLYNKPTQAPGEAGVAVQKMLDAIYLAAEKGKEVTIK